MAKHSDRDEHSTHRTDPLATFLEELSRVQDDHRLLVLVAHGVVELFVNTIAESKCQHGEKIASDTRG